jgi:putative transposase
MLRVFQPFFLLLATAADRESARMVEYLKAENRVLRSRLPRRVVVSPAERRRLVQLGAKLGPAIRDLISVVTPRPFALWLAGEAPAKRRVTRKPGRPRTEGEVREIVLRLARETGWGTPASSAS